MGFLDGPIQFMMVHDSSGRFTTVHDGSGKFLSVYEGPIWFLLVQVQKTIAFESVFPYTNYELECSV